MTGPGHDLQLERLVEILEVEIDGPVDPVNVVERLIGCFFFRKICKATLDETV